MRNERPGVRTEGVSGGVGSNLMRGQGCPRTKGPRGHRRSNPTQDQNPLLCGVHIARRETRMSAHVVVHFNLKDEELWKAYGQAAGPLVAAHGGKMISRGPSEVLSGALDRASMVIIEFPDRASAKRWYTSPEYQAIIPNRDAGMDSIFIVGGE
ncbi:MAG: DUF1330 domain-containing protein [Chloroflexi bacterium]|nr:MAG: DUF1330 domain-containing protein [Chloroflexota bacterium]